MRESVAELLAMLPVVHVLEQLGIRKGRVIDPPPPLASFFGMAFIVVFHSRSIYCILHLYIPAMDEGIVHSSMIPTFHQKKQVYKDTKATVLQVCGFFHHHVQYMSPICEWAA
jgi:hypothetical protein